MSMQYRRLGHSGAVVSALALGTMTFGSETPAGAASDQLDLFVGAGGTLIETADVYGGGAAEEIVGDWLRRQSGSIRSDVFLAAKGRFPVGVTPRDAGLSARHLRRALEGSLRRLGVDHVDLYQVHAWDPVTPLEETLGFLDRAVQAGTVVYAGLSNFTGWQIAQGAAQVGQRFPLISMQPQYNLLCREVEWEIIPACLANGLGVLPWSPLGGGWLTGKYRRDRRPTGATRLGENPGRGVEAYDLRGAQPRTWRVLDTLAAVAERHDEPMARIALAWLAARPGVASVIVGARTSEQLADNLGSTTVELTTEDVRALDEASDPEPAPWPYGTAGIEQRSRPLD